MLDGPSVNCRVHNELFSLILDRTAMYYRAQCTHMFDDNAIGNSNYLGNLFKPCHGKQTILKNNSAKSQNVFKGFNQSNQKNIQKACCKMFSQNPNEFQLKTLIYSDKMTD